MTKTKLINFVKINKEQVMTERENDPSNEKYCHFLSQLIV